MSRWLPVNSTATLIFCFFSLVLITCIVLTINGLAPIDDHQFARTLLQGKSFVAYFIPELGRFFPFLAQEYVFASMFIKPTPFLFYSIGAIKVMLAGLLLLYCLRQTRTGNLAILGLWSVAIFSIGFANAATRLQVGELNILILSLVFLCSILFLENVKSSKRVKYRFVLIIELFAIFITLFYKELAFVFALIFAIAEIARKRRQGERPIPGHLWILLAISISYISFYFFWRVFYVTGSYASFSNLSVLELISLYAENDPFIVFVVFPVTIIRVFYCVRNAREQTMFDSMLFAAIAYCACYLVLGMFAHHYLLPAYGFAACGIAGILKLKFVRIAQSLVLLLICVFAVNNLPLAVSDMQTLKLTANNHYRFVQAASKWINSHPLPDASRRTLVLVGVSPGTGIEILESLKQFLILFGTPESAFSIRPTEPSDNKKISDFYGFKMEHGYEPVEGDLLIFNPYTQKQVHPPLQSPSYLEVHRSELTWAVPRWTARNWLDICLLSKTSCEARCYAQRRFAGYSAMLVKRMPAALPALHPLKSPAYHHVNLTLPSQMERRKTIRLEVMIRNMGTETWPANGSLNPGLVHLAYRWLNKNGDVVLEGDRSALPEPIQPNDMVKVEIILSSPRVPGKYLLELRPVQEGVLWFPGPPEKVIEVN